MKTEMTTTTKFLPCTIKWIEPTKELSGVLNIIQGHNSVACSRSEAIQIRDFLNQLELEETKP